MEIITREQWNARAPREVHHTDWAHRTLFVLHHSGAPATQTVRQIQDFHMDVRGWSDIGYNWIVRAGRIYEGRGWLTIGAHAKGYNTVGVGVCVVGYNGSAADKACVKWLFDEANRRKRNSGSIPRNLKPRGHRDVGNTECPGDELYSWLKSGLIIPTPAPEPAPDTLEETVLKMPVLRQGSRGFAVELVQRLVNQHDRAGLKPDGDWGPATDAAVRRYQAVHKVPNSVRADGTGDGVWGPACWTYALAHVG